MIWVTTIATHGRYLEWAEAMRAPLEAAGYGFHLERELSMPARRSARGTTSLNAKVDAIRNCFRLHGGVDGVYWLDADCEIQNLGFLCKLLVSVPAKQMRVGRVQCFEESMNWYYDESQKAWMRSNAEAYGVPFGDLVAPADQLMGFGMYSVMGMLELWKAMAEDLDRQGLVISDGVVSALAAKASGIDVVSAWGERDFFSALSHESHSNHADGWKPGVQ